MVYEYLIFNLFVITGPLLFGSLKRFYFLDRWRIALIATAIVAIPFIIWDSLVTGRHWIFNQDYISGLQLFNLPLEEWLFFFTVPFACLFSWEMLNRFTGNAEMRIMKKLRYALYLLVIPGIFLFARGQEYTGLVLISLSLAFFIDQVLASNLILQTRFYIYIAVILFFTLIFNGFLTWRPVVLYGESYQLGFRIFTIPVEDFGYGLSMLIATTSIFERLKTSRIFNIG